VVREVYGEFQTSLASNVVCMSPYIDSLSTWQVIWSDINCTSSFDSARAKTQKWPHNLQFWETTFKIGTYVSSTEV